MRVAFVVGLIFSIPSILHAQDWRDKLRADLVVERDDKMVIEKYAIERVDLPGSAPVELQVKYYMETARDGAISRDNFIHLSAHYGATALQAMLAEDHDVSAAAFLAAYDSENLDAPTGTPDLEISIVITGDGVEIEIRNTSSNEVSRITETWVPPNPVLLAAEEGDADAQYAAGMMYADGDGVAEDVVQAYMWFNLSAAQGNVAARGGKDMIQARMTREQIAEAQRLSSEWIETHQF